MSMRAENYSECNEAIKHFFRLLMVGPLLLFVNLKGSSVVEMLL